MRLLSCKWARSLLLRKIFWLEFYTNDKFPTQWIWKASLVKASAVSALALQMVASLKCNRRLHERMKGRLICVCILNSLHVAFINWFGRIPHQNCMSFVNCRTWTFIFLKQLHELVETWNRIFVSVVMPQLCGWTKTNFVFAPQTQTHINIFSCGAGLSDNGLDYSQSCLINYTRREFRWGSINRNQLDTKLQILSKADYRVNLTSGDTWTKLPPTWRIIV